MKINSSIYEDLILPAMAQRPSRAAAMELQQYLNTATSGKPSKAASSTSSHNLNSSYEYGSKFSQATVSETSS